MSFLKSGRKQSIRKSIKEGERALQDFNKTLMAMNSVYFKLKEDETVTEENIEEKIKEVSSYSFTQTHIDMLKRDICKS